MAKDNQTASPTPAREPPDVLAASRWRRVGPEWQLYLGKRRLGRLVPDGKYPGMWRSIMPDGSLSDMANVTWAKHAVAESARRDLEYIERKKVA
jgi:hypothetical protein